MIFTLVIIAAVAAAFIWAMVNNKRLEAQVAAVNQECERIRQHFESETERVYGEAQASVAAAQGLMDQQFDAIKQESERVRQHYESEARKSQEEANALIAKLGPFLKFEDLGEAQRQAERQLADAIKEASALRAQAQTLLDQAKKAAVEQRFAAQEKVRDIHDQADARLNQALRDAGRIVAEAERRAEQIAGEAYSALRDKQMLEQAAEAMRNLIEGYGDRYLVPTHSLLDDLAAEYGYDASGRALASAREQSKRMVEQGEAATCDYAEANRRKTAIQFVIHAFNGHVDSLLTRVKHDNFGILEQKIKDAFSIVNKDGSAFRNARVLPAYLAARLAELKWAVVVQELALRDREEQRYQNDRRRDEEKARKEQEKRVAEAEKEEAIKKAALDEAERKLANATAEMKAQYERELQEARQRLAEATETKLTIAQQTAKGRIYVISNVGSFGEEVYKIGLTRRAAQERIDELGNASVPFEFDIHAVIETDNAPALEFKIHQQFLSARVNKINMRKEFFRVNLGEIRQCIEKLEEGKDFKGVVTWTERGKAQQYYDTLDIEKDAQSREKWLERARLLAERRQRFTPKGAVLENGEDNGTD